MERIAEILCFFLKDISILSNLTSMFEVGAGIAITLSIFQLFGTLRFARYNTELLRLERICDHIGNEDKRVRLEDTIVLIKGRLITFEKSIEGPRLAYAIAGMCLFGVDFLLIALSGVYPNLNVSAVCFLLLFGVAIAPFAIALIDLFVRTDKDRDVEEKIIEAREILAA